MPKALHCAFAADSRFAVKEERADVNERRRFFFGKSRLERYKARDDELCERLDYFEDKKQTGAKRTLLRRGGEGGIRTLEAR